MNSDFIVDVSESDFEYQVLAYSQETPVVVDFWAEWCIPCKVLGPILESLAEENEGAFRLARVDVDHNPNLARQFRVTSIPTVKAFRDGMVVAELHGAQPEPKVREFLRSIIPSEADLLFEKGMSLLSLGRPQEAEETFQQVLDESPDHDGALLGLSKSLLLQGESREGFELLRNFPAGRLFSKAETLLPLAQVMEKSRIETVKEFDDNPLEAAYARCLRLVRRGNIEAAMDIILDILRQDKNFRSGEPRKVMLALLELIGEDNPISRQYRNELASVLF